MQQAVWAVVGPTASGKTAVAMALAQACSAEIVACDSVQVYRQFDIGSAKPSLEEQRACPHHVIDVVSWDEPFDASRYVSEARKAVFTLHTQGKQAVVCGGTGLYLRAFRYGLLPLTASQPDVRERLQQMETDSPGAAYAMLEQHDPESAAAVHPSNLVHVLRALEIVLVSGEKASALRAKHGFKEEQQPMKVFCLEWPAEVLKKRIWDRTGHMLAHGLVEEVESLLSQQVPPTAKPMCSVGYKETCAMLMGQLPYAQLHDTIAANTWQYARRQRTWFKKEKNTTVLCIEDGEKSIEKTVRQILNMS